MFGTNKVSGIWDTAWKKIEKALSKKGFKTVVLNNERMLRKFIYDNIPDNVVVGLGSSLSTSVLKIRNILLEKGNKVYYAWNGSITNRSMDTFEEHPRPDFFLTTANSITPEGTLVNSEYSGKAAKEKGLPRNIIAFSNIRNINKKFTNRSINSEFVVIDKKPETSNITVAMTSFA